MFKILEVYFDLFYLLVAFGFGVRLLLEKSKSAKLLSIMSILLALGDSFHLIPRVYGHLSIGGLEANIVYLSYGQMVTSFTMSIFYILYYYYYKIKGGKTSNLKNIALFSLFSIRLLLLILPQNNWGGISPYYMAILRNIPFLFMGILLIIWTYKDIKLDGMKKISYLIMGSFFFYSLVIAISPFLLAFGAFMMPKTVCYVLIIYNLYKKEVPNFTQLDLLKLSITGLILGLILGVFYREFTKLFAYSAYTTLSIAHTHMLILGFIFSFVLYILYRLENINIKNIKILYICYIIGLIYLISSFLLRGIYKISSNGNNIYSDAMLIGFAGLGHIILGISIVAILVKTFFAIDKKKY